jgi:hypothetical protein
VVLLETGETTRWSFAGYTALYRLFVAVPGTLEEGCEAMARSLASTTLRRSDDSTSDDTDSCSWRGQFSGVTVNVKVVAERELVPDNKPIRAPDGMVIVTLSAS